MRPEIELLLCCARTRMDAQCAARARALLQAGIDWDELLQVASVHSVVPLLYWSLQSTCPEAVPQPILGSLRAHFQANAQRNLFLTQELLKLLCLLEGQGILAIPLKGPVLASLAYRNLAFRQFSDLDILVRERDVLRAKDLIVAQGYQPCVDLQEGQEANYVRSGRELPMRRDDGQVAIDLQWRMPAEWLPQRYLPFGLESFWKERLERFSIAGTVVLSMSPEELLLILCVHGLSHRWERLSWICDIAELVSARPQLDWNRAMARARALDAERAMLVGLFLAGDLLDARLSAQVVDKIRSTPQVERLGLLLRERLCEGQEGSSHLFKEAAYFIESKDRLRDRVVLALHYLWAYVRPGLIPTDEDRALLPLPQSLSFLHYLIKPMRMLQRYGLNPIGRALGQFVNHFHA